MKKLKFKKYVILLIGLISCSDISVNTEQVKTTLRNIQCCKDLIDELTDSQEIITMLVELRNSRIKALHDPLKTKQSYRTITTDEFISLVSKQWKISCYDKLAKTKDLNGIRFISKEEIIIEIDDFKRHTLNEQYSGSGIYEIHRIVISNSKPDTKAYKLQTEYIVWEENLGDNWTYEVSHCNKMY